MKFILIFISIIGLNLQSTDLNDIRIAYKAAAHDSSKVMAYNTLLAKTTKSDKIELVAYKAAGIALQGKFAKKLKDKRTLFIEGVTLLEYAIEKAPNNIELRFIRLGIQENTPKLLKYKEQIEKDKKFIIKNFSTIKTKHLKHHIQDYILQSKIFSVEEQEKLIN